MSNHIVRSLRRSSRLGAPSLILALVIGQIIPALGGPAGQSYEGMTRRYMETYQAYLRAKMAGDPAAPQRLKEFNDAYQEFLAILNKGQGKGHPAGSPPAAATATPMPSANAKPPRAAAAVVGQAAPAPAAGSPSQEPSAQAPANSAHAAVVAPPVSPSALATPAASQDPLASPAVPLNAALASPGLFSPLDESRAPLAAASNLLASPPQESAGASPSGIASPPGIGAEPATTAIMLQAGTESAVASFAPVVDRDYEASRAAPGGQPPHFDPTADQPIWDYPLATPPTMTPREETTAPDQATPSSPPKEPSLGGPADRP